MAPRSTRSVLAAASAATVLALLVAGCGGSSGPNAQTVRSAGTKTLAQKTVQLSVSLDNPTLASKPSVGSGGYDLQADQGHYTTLTLYGVAGIPDGDQAEAILHLPTVYAHPLGAAAHALPITTPWLTLDLRTLANIPGLNLGTIAEAQSADPRPFLLFLAGATPPLTKVGTEQAGGTSTTHYRLSVDLNQAVKGLSGNDATTLNKDLASYTSALVPTEVWIDSSGLVRQMLFHLSVKEAAGKPPTAEQVKFTFTGFGAPVDTAAPPASQTTDISQLLKAAAGG